jgi:replication initiation and membrane attachment protein
MKDFSPSDLFETRPQSLFSSRDQDYVLDFYAPLVGLKAVAFYFALKEENAGETLSFESFLKKEQSSIGEMNASLSALEAVGLVASYLKKGEKFNYFIFALYAPKTPKEFFDNVLFIGTLRKYLDNDKIDALAKKYPLLPLPSDFENVSEGFRDYFAPDFDDPDFRLQSPDTGGRQTGTLQIGFDRNVFFKELAANDPRFSEKSFSQEELVLIADYAALYSYSEETMADFVRQNFSFSAPASKRVNFKGLKKICEDSIKLKYLHSIPAKKSLISGDNEVAVTLRRMDSSTPVDFLVFLQHGHKPAEADLHLLETLRVDMGLPDPVVNALIFYVVTEKDGQLPNNYTTKLAGALVRKSLCTAQDAWDYFTRTRYVPKSSLSVDSKPESGSSIKSEKEGENKQAEADSVDEEPVMSDEEIQAALRNLYSSKTGKD